MRAIALRAGVSSATVSRVINGSPLVTEATAERIRKILDEVGYIPNPMATTLKYGRSKTYGLVIPDICNPFYSELLAEFEDLLAETDQELLLANVSTPEKLLKSVRRMLMRQVDGAILMASEFYTEGIEPLLRHKIPLVTVDRQQVEAGCSDVAVDFEAGFSQAVKHLYALGHTRIGFIGGQLGVRTSTIRLSAYKSALESCGLSYNPAFVREGDYRVPGGDMAVRLLMKEKVRPTAILTANDLTAFGAIRGLHALGLNVPKDISVVGLDDVLLSDVLQPQLTTVRIPRRRMADACLHALEHGKQNVNQHGIQLSVTTELVLRESTAQALIKAN